MNFVVLKSLAGTLTELFEVGISRLFGRLTRDQKTLRARIADAVAGAGGRDIVFTSEWLGYLPFGAYCWLEHTDATGVTTEIKLPFGCGESDLAALVRCGFLEQIGARRNPDDLFDYTLTYRVREGSSP